MQQIIVRESKGNKHRTTILPETLFEALEQRITTTRAVHEFELARGYRKVYLPYALARKYKDAAADFKWQYIFPASRLSMDPRDGTLKRHHIHETWGKNR